MIGLLSNTTKLAIKKEDKTMDNKFMHCKSPIKLSINNKQIINNERLYLILREKC